MDDFMSKTHLLLQAELRRIEIQKRIVVERNVYYALAGAVGFGCLVFADVAAFLLLADRIGTVPASIANAGFLAAVALLLTWRGGRVSAEREAEMAEEMARLARAGVQAEISQVTRMVGGVTGDIRRWSSLGAGPAGMVGVAASLALQLLPLLQKKRRQ